MIRVALPQFDGTIQRTRIANYIGDIETDTAKLRTIKACEAIAGKLSKPSKMPGWAYSIPASRCRTGQKLAKIPGTVCHGCYAADDWEWLNQPGRVSRFSRYAVQNVKDAMGRRFDSLTDPQWVPAMVSMIRKRCKGGLPFRWHDSGDIQTLEHLANIAAVAACTPGIAHWIPTREYRDVSAYLERFGPFPANLAVRVSAHRVDESAPTRFPLSSMVLSGSVPDGVHGCPAYSQGGKCGSCRACWDQSVPIVGYPEH